MIIHLSPRLCCTLAMQGPAARYHCFALPIPSVAAHCRCKTTHCRALAGQLVTALRLSPTKRPTAVPLLCKAIQSCSLRHIAFAARFQTSPRQASPKRYPAALCLCRTVRCAAQLCLDLTLLSRTSPCLCATLPCSAMPYRYSTATPTTS